MLIFIFLLLALPPLSLSTGWTWTCDPDSTFCRREVASDETEVQGESRCRLTCAPSSLLWPLPTSSDISQENIRAIVPSEITVIASSPSIKELVEKAVSWQVDLLNILGVSGRKDAILAINIMVEEENLDVSLANESYSLTVAEREQGQISAQITAHSYFGARHGIESLFQLIVWDSQSSSFLLPSQLEIEDSPAFPHRGVMLDTARNFIPIENIKKLLDSMSYSKLNVFHWHVTDSQSYPLHLPSLPEFSQYGSYGVEKVYSQEQVQDVVHYAMERGIQVIPELDAPAHVGAGWEAADESFTTCVYKEPWSDWCVEPPCGQLNPAIPELYPFLETMYGDWLDAFNSPSTFHIGQDEVHFGCWNSTPSIIDWLEDQGKGTQEEDFMFLWSHFLNESTESLASAAAPAQSPGLIMWNNHLTLPQYINLLDKDKFTVQLWTDSTDLEEPTIRTVAEGGFKMIFSNHDATYLDCGLGGWVANGHNWCSPYKQWQAQYMNDPFAILENQGVSNLEEAKSNVLGGEVALWTEQTDAFSMMSRIEPRASAYAERLWRGPSTGDWYDAERRLVIHRDRLASRNIGADSLTHGWCRQNEGKCLLEEEEEEETTTTAPRNDSKLNKSVTTVLVISILSLMFCK